MLTRSFSAIQQATEQDTINSTRTPSEPLGFLPHHITMLHQVRAKLQPAQVAYLEKEVLPPLSLSIEQLLREIQNFVDTVLA